MAKVVVITGGRRGIGKSIVDKFLTEGYFVASCSKNEVNLDKPNLLLMKCDVSKLSDVKKFYNKVIKKFSSVDILVNNAGVAFNRKLEEVSIDEIDLTLDTNLKGLIYFTKIFLDKLKESNGFIINIASVAGLKGYSDLSVYCASKFGVVGFSESLRKELKKVKVYCICPGPVATDMWTGLGWIKYPGITKPSNIADKVFDCVVNKPKDLIIK